MEPPSADPSNQSAVIQDSFTADRLNPYWKPWAIGTGTVDHTPGVVRCELKPDPPQQYSDAQITDYQGLPRRAFPWSPPVRLIVRAWASHPMEAINGTAGFGFWNEPFVPVGTTLPRLPRAVWFFFGSPPNNMALAQGVPGFGWKAATLDSTRPGFLALAPVAPIGFLLMRFPALYRRLWPVGQRALGASEAILPVDLGDPHDYQLDWLPDSVIFQVDGQRVHHAPYSPRGPLGFIAWIDNQYAVVTPQGQFRFGTLAIHHPQALIIEQIEIRSWGRG